MQQWRQHFSLWAASRRRGPSQVAGPVTWELGMSTSAALDYYRSQVCAPQWRGFLRAMAAEFADALPGAELHRLMARMGERFAQSHPLPACDDLVQLQQACNQVWTAAQWGSVRFVEHPAQVSIEHLGSPLAALLGTDADWAGGFLEGAYRHWFNAAGMLPTLDVGHAGNGTADLQRYVLSRVA